MSEASSHQYQGRQSALQVFKEFGGGVGDPSLHDDDDDEDDDQDQDDQQLPETEKEKVSFLKKMILFKAILFPVKMQNGLAFQSLLARSYSSYSQQMRSLSLPEKSFSRSLLKLHFLPQQIPNKTTLAR